jgi:hypothetical protein
MGWTFYNSSGQQLRATADKAATQAEMETGTSTSVYVTPGRLHFAPSALKCHITIPANGVVTPSSGNSYGIASVGDTGTGDRDVNFTTAFTTATYATAASITDTSAGNLRVDTQTTGDVRIVTIDLSDSGADRGSGQVSAGDFA